MRITKAILQKRLEAAEQFQKYELVGVKTKDVMRVQNMAGFVPAACYPIGQVPMQNEIGMIENRRFLKWRIRVSWQG